MMESTSTAILTASSQAAISLTPSLSIAAIGAVTGKIVSATQMGLLGNINSKDENQRGDLPPKGIPLIKLELPAF